MLGKLTAAVGVGFAVASTPEAKPRTAPKAKDLTYKTAPGCLPYPGWENIQTTPLSYEALEKTYEDWLQSTRNGSD